MSIIERLFTLQHGSRNSGALLLLVTLSLLTHYAYGYYPPDPPAECSSSIDDVERGRCLLDRVYQAGDTAAEVGLDRAAYRQQAGSALAQIEEMAAPPAWLLSEARFAWAWANDPDNSVFNDPVSDETDRLTIAHYQTVCWPPNLETDSVEHDISQLLCTVARQRIHLLENGLDRARPDDAAMKAVMGFIERYPLLKSDTGLDEANQRLARRLVVLGLGFASAERVGTQFKQAAGLAFMMLSVADAQRDGPDREAVAFAAGIAQLVDLLRPAELPRQDYNIKLVALSHRLLSAAFPPESHVVINSNQLQTDMDIDIALNPVYPPAMRSAAAAEARGLIDSLTQNALQQREYATQRERLEVVQMLFERLEHVMPEPESEPEPEPEQHPEFAAVCPVEI
ncbi:hypothetical protein [Pseudescherichia sp.]|uniref:hypothetical protein n=1 Tax=Pseudescherichia sp. TaxID=2055881 RepID=UPI00289DA8CE|nr:hypothetical protein [Pseudescherichia sp.]